MDVRESRTPAVHLLGSRARVRVLEALLIAPGTVSELARADAGTLLTTVWFCRGWNPPFGLLGQEGFLDYYRLTLDVREGWFALEPST